MKKVLTIVLIMVASVLPQGDNIRLYRRDFYSMGGDWKICFYRAFGVKKSISIEGLCPYYIIYNKSTGGWTY
jgi:hypothetical protein